MFEFNAGGRRPVTGKLRADTLRAANDLVQRTLAKHGLASPVGVAEPYAGAGKAGTQKNTSARPARPAGRVAQAMRSETFQNSAGTRDFRIYVPQKAQQEARGLVMMLHGCTQTPEDFAIGTQMNALAGAQGFITVWPEQNRGHNAQSCWNWFSPQDQQRDRGEPAILAGMAERCAAEYRVPSSKIFVAGLSAGAAMAVILGETYADVFSAVGAHSGLAYASAQDVPSALAAMAGTAAPGAAASGAALTRTVVFHGSDDRTVQPANGTRIVEDARGRWQDLAFETETSEVINGRRTDRYSVTDAEGRSLVEHWRIDGLGHAWSGGNTGGSHADQAGPDASAEMVRFFFDTDKETGA